jgi:integrase
LLGTGVRIGEARAVGPTAVDLAAGTLTIIATVFRGARRRVANAI